MDRFGPTGKVSKKRVHLKRWTRFFPVGPVGILVEWIAPYATQNNLGCASEFRLVNTARTSFWNETHS